MDKIDKVFYINLERRQDRKDHFIQSCLKDAQIPLDKITRINALDGKTYVPTEEETKMFLKCDFLNMHFYNNILCNQLGHYYTLKEIIKNNYKYALVCQDDVYFRSDFQNYFAQIMENFPEDAEMLTIGLHSYANYEHFVQWDLTGSPTEDFLKIGGTKINDYVCRYNNGVNPCSLAYIVTLKGAINLVEHFDKTGFRRATDHNFNTYLIEKNIFYGCLPVLCTGNANLKSDIFT